MRGQTLLEHLFHRIILLDPYSIHLQTTFAIQSGQKNFRQGEVFYARYIPSGGHYFTFRVPVLPGRGPLKSRAPNSDQLDSEEAPDLCLDSEQAHDLELIHRWMEDRLTDST